MASFADSRVWFITGVSSGLGRALLEAVLAANERAVGTVRNPASVADLTAKYPKEQLLILQLDVNNADQIAETFKTIESHFHRLDVVVNNAGYAVTGEIEATPDDEARRQIETLFWGPVNITKQAIRFFREVNPKGHGGRVLNVSSIGGYAANATLAFYSAGKFALEGFTEAFTREMPAEWNIKGVIIEPGGFKTNWSGSSMVQLPPHPAYDENSPSAKFKKMRENVRSGGNVERAALAMIRIAGEPNPPLRLQLGTDSWGIATFKAKKTLEDAEKWAELSHSTNSDGVGLEILDFLKEAL